MNQRRTYLLGLLALLLWPAAGARAASWRGITPLKSTRADVERLLGPPHREYGRYDFPEETASIRYAVGKHCDDANDCWCVAPKDVVTNIFVYVSFEMKFSELKLDLREYKKFTSPTAPHHTTYSNEKEGVTYTVTEDGEVHSIDYYPSESDCEETVRQRGGKRSSAGTPPATRPASDLRRIDEGAYRRAGQKRRKEAEVSDDAPRRLFRDRPRRDHLS